MTSIARMARNRGVTLYSRRRWGSKQQALYLRRLVTRPTKRREKDTLWQHISVTRDDGPDPVNFFADMQELERIGMDRFGSGISYNVAIDMTTGEAGLGQRFLAKGTHTINHKDIPGYSKDQNAVSLAFVFIGMPGQKPSKKAIRTAGIIYGILIDKKLLTVDPDYNSHRMVAFKSCPTDAVVAVMPQIEKIAFQTSIRRRRVMAARKR